MSTAHVGRVPPTVRHSELCLRPFPVPPLCLRRGLCCVAAALPSGELDRHQGEHPGHERERGSDGAHVGDTDAGHHGAAHGRAKRDADVIVYSDALRR